MNEGSSLFFGELRSKEIQENYFSVIYSDDMVNWYDSTNYQFEELNKALIFFKNNPNLSYKSTYNNYSFHIIPCNKKKDIFIMVRNDFTFAYLKFNKEYIRKKAIKDINVIYLDKNIIKIKKNDFYWVRTSNPDIPMVGWHGSTNPPRDMAGRSMVGTNHI